MSLTSENKRIEELEIICEKNTENIIKLSNEIEMLKKYIANSHETINMFMKNLETNREKDKQELRKLIAVRRVVQQNSVQSTQGKPKQEVVSDSNSEDSSESEEEEEELVENTSRYIKRSQLPPTPSQQNRIQPIPTNPKKRYAGRIRTFT